MADQSYVEDILAWRNNMDASLRAENSWLALCGLFWLQEGDQTIGTAPDCSIVLPEGSAADQVGTLTLQEGIVTLQASAPDSFLVDGKPAPSMILEPDDAPSPTWITIGRLTAIAIRRGQRYGIRVWDNHRRERTTFPTRTWFHVQEAYRIEATFTAYDPPHELVIPNVLGESENVPASGNITFTFQNRPFRIDALGDQSSGLFLIFADRTNGHATYPAGRFLSTEAVQGNRIIVDFNRAYNPPCAFTPFATCPLPPFQNRLDVSIQAGERYVKASPREGGASIRVNQ